MKTYQILALGFLLVQTPALFGQSQKFYSGSNVTGLLVLTGTVNLRQLAQHAALPQVTRLSSLESILPSAARERGRNPMGGGSRSDRELPLTLPKRLHPPMVGGENALRIRQVPDVAALEEITETAVRPAVSLFAVGASTPVAGAQGFNGLTHLDQRNANGGNQFSVEPPSPAIAVGNGFVLQGVNNAVQVYDLTGAPLLPAVVSSNELFGLPPAIDRSTGINGPFPTDMRVFYDPDINRFFVLQWVQANDAAGNPLSSSREWLAVSQTSDPTGGYNIYSMDTTDQQNPMCPCIPDYPQLGADRYGFYISSNEYNSFGQSFVNANILALSKSSLASGAPIPTAFKFTLPMSTGYEFAIQPATTPVGSGYFLGNGGLEYFVSSRANLAQDKNMAIWAMYNTSSLWTTSPNPSLTRIDVGTLMYAYPDVARQRTGPLPYGSQLYPPNGYLAYIDGGDSRILSVSYAFGRLYVVLGSQVVDASQRSVVGGAYVVFSPVFRGGILAAPVFRQGYLVATGNNIVRPAIAVNAEGKGAIAFTLVGPDYYPSAAMVTFDATVTTSALQVVSMGSAPEDGFTGYQYGVARWGDYSAAVVAGDGTIWMATEYIPNAPRTPFANWGTFIMPFKP